MGCFYILCYRLYERKKKKTEMLKKQLHKLNLTETDKVRYLYIDY